LVQLGGGSKLLSFMLYGVFYKLMLTQGKILAGLVMLALMVLMGCGLLSVILFAKANEVKEASAKRRMVGSTELNLSEGQKELLPETHTEPLFGVTDRTTELLFVEKKSNAKES